MSMEKLLFRLLERGSVTGAIRFLTRNSIRINPGIERPFKEGADFDYLTRVMTRKISGGPVPILEVLVDGDILSEVVEGESTVQLCMSDLLNLDLEKGLTLDELRLIIKLMRLSVEFGRVVGYDGTMMLPVVPIPRTPMEEAFNPRQGRNRLWQRGQGGAIKSRDDIDRFPWPSLDEISIFPILFIIPMLPPGMKIMAFYQGIFEDLRDLMGFETMAIKTIEDPRLVDDVLERLTVLAEETIDQCMKIPEVGALIYSEDMGFKTGPMLSPGFMRDHVFPRQKRLADICHAHGKPFLLHSCGNIDSLMDDLIDYVGIDAKHSFQDNIEPVEVAYRKYHDRIGIIGGLDVDLLARGTTAQVRERCRRILDACGPRGGYCMGSGNSVTNYCKVENFYAMVDETGKWNRERFGTD